MAALKQPRAQQQGSVLVVVLALLAVSSLVLVDNMHNKQRRLHEELERTHLAELQVVAKSVFIQAGLELEQNYSETQQWPQHWQVPAGIDAHVQLVTEPCPSEQKEECYKVELTLYGRGGTSLKRSQRYWGDPSCGVWDKGS